LFCCSEENRNRQKALSFRPEVDTFNCHSFTCFFFEKPIFVFDKDNQFGSRILENNA
jgi:hypothetical protein